MKGGIMLKFLWIAKKDIFLFIRDWKALLLFIIAPLVLVSVLGFALADIIDEEVEIDSFQVVFVNEGKDQLGDQIFKQLKEIGKDQFAIKQLTKSEADRQKKDGSLPVVVYFPNGFSQNLQVEVEYAADEELQGEIIANMLRQVTQAIRNQDVVVETIQQKLSPLTNNSQPVMKPQGEVGKLVADADFVFKSLEKDQTPISSFQYYAIAIGSMFLLITGMNGLSSIIEERNQLTYQRMLISSVPVPVFLLGKFVSNMIICFLQLTALIVGTYYLFDVSWGDDFLALTSLMFASTFAVTGIVMLLASFVTSSMAVNLINGIGVQVFSLLGGSMFPITSFPEFMQYLAYISPNYWMIQGFIDVMRGLSLAEIIVPLMVLVGMGLFSLVLGWFRLNQK
jgi:ABC-2 type transport system permease protein